MVHQIIVEHLLYAKHCAGVGPHEAFDTVKDFIFLEAVRPQKIVFFRPSSLAVASQDLS